VYTGNNIGIPFSDFFAESRKSGGIQFTSGDSYVVFAYQQPEDVMHALAVRAVVRDKRPVLEAETFSRPLSAGNASDVAREWATERSR
jgi:hypothetical protein